MITGVIKSQVDKIWNAFWAGGISNGLTVIEQITYLLFARRLDELHTAKEKQSNLLKTPIEEPIFGKKQQQLRWSRFKDFEPQKMYKTFRDEVFPFIKQLHQDRQSAYSRYMKDAVFVIPTPSLLERVVTMISDIPMEDRDTKGDLYEYLLSKLQHQGRNGQFRTPRHIIKMMVELLDPQPTDIIGDPACGTCGFLVAAGEYLREHQPEMFHKKKQREHFSQGMFHGSDFDSSMLRIGAMNMMLHGVENPDIADVDALSEDGAGIRDRYTVLLANPPFKGSLNYEEVAKDLLQLSKTKKTELLFVSLFVQQLKSGGRCACIVPDGVLFGSSKAHKDIRQMLVEDQKLDGVISMPSGVFKPYAGVSTAVLLFTRTNSGGTEHVWFYDMQADGYSLDDKRDTVEANDIPDLVERWKNRNPKKKSDRKGKAFFVPVAEIVENKYDLSINRYKEVEYDEVEYDPPEMILDQLEALEAEIVADLKELRGMLH
ncbi:type I restriction-modification system subunit M [Lignipirellula cremea]|uniref:site-specific DNA-methyltransferase (adenine-specific) n=1 Tax=Lignipirellula cremea TaxID=2528010 RepID=A0A518E3B0_9BACT|nr:class I SAM-dependent DNA methyltransferase [Lignipirellula cremea]QDU98577.1 putative type I restriction enzymeP M protein [Lignipirellula cremea]